MDDVHTSSSTTSLPRLPLARSESRNPIAAGATTIRIRFVRASSRSTLSFEMVAGGPSSRVNGVERFYNPPALRRQLQLQQKKLQDQQQQQQQQQQPVPPPARTVHRPAKPRTKASDPTVQVRDTESRADLDDLSPKPSVSSSSSSSSASPLNREIAFEGNLKRFLESTAPTVPAFFPKGHIRGRSDCDGEELCPYFTLEDLWESFREWSAYGAGVPLVLNGSDSVVQYYVPYLSAIQLYVSSSKLVSRSRQRPSDESNGDAYQVSSSDGSEDENERRSRERIGIPSGQQWFLPGGAESCNCLEPPIFEYLERDPPYGREPLVDKVSSLARIFPALKAYKSCDLLPSSWVSVAWYPIYRIPTGPTLRDLDACFLTFHFLATPFRSSGSENLEFYGASSSSWSSLSEVPPSRLSLPTFGLAAYKFKGSIWTSNGPQDRQLAMKLLQEAEDWLRQARVNHPDFQFFISHWS